VELAFSSRIFGQYREAFARCVCYHAAFCMMEYRIVMIIVKKPVQQSEFCREKNWVRQTQQKLYPDENFEYLKVSLIRKFYIMT
jgi:hypothetical protein